MRAVGIVVEYNPFHFGHAYHIEQSRIKSQADIVIAVMSGPFLQRGEPAIVPKHIRAKMALLGGVDLVVELPFAFAVQRADVFAKGAVEILAACGCDTIAFGSEDGDIDHFKETIEFIQTHHELYNQLLKEALALGDSYPKAHSKAFTTLSNQQQKLIDLSKPNNILGFQYVQAISEANARITPMTIQRKQANYHDESLPESSQTIASATSIRKTLLEENQLQAIANFVPKQTLRELHGYQQKFHTFHNWDQYWPYLQYQLLTSSVQELRHVYDIHEGIEYRLLQAAKTSSSFTEFIQQVKTKRYTWTRLQRMAVHLLLQSQQMEMDQAIETPRYIRLLGMTEKGRKYLKEKKKQIGLPTVSKLSASPLNGITHDIKAANIYALGVPISKRAELLKWEYAMPPILV